MAKVDVELWDTSGNPRFDNCWPALSRDAHGVMFVFHPGKFIDMFISFHIQSYVFRVAVSIVSYYI